MCLTIILDRFDHCFVLSKLSDNYFERHPILSALEFHTDSAELAFLLAHSLSEKHDNAFLHMASVARGGYQG